MIYLQEVRKIFSQTLFQPHCSTFYPKSSLWDQFSILIRDMTHNSRFETQLPRPDQCRFQVQKSYLSLHFGSQIESQGRASGPVWGLDPELVVEDVSIFECRIPDWLSSPDLRVRVGSQGIDRWGCVPIQISRSVKRSSSNVRFRVECQGQAKIDRRGRVVSWVSSCQGRSRISYWAFLLKVFSTSSQNK